uniref:Uncharacterized protein n=1 Tax=Equus caballus TaxID=9796 RepID=A0A3Q2KNU5_HORSE
MHNGRFFSKTDLTAGLAFWGASMAPGKASHLQSTSSTLVAFQNTDPTRKTCQVLTTPQLHRGPSQLSKKVPAVSSVLSP